MSDGYNGLQPVWRGYNLYGNPTRTKPIYREDGTGRMFVESDMASNPGLQEVRIVDNDRGLKIFVLKRGGE